MAHDFPQAAWDNNILWMNGYSFAASPPYTINAWFKTSASGTGSLAAVSLYAGSIINGHALRISTTTNRVQVRSSDGVGFSSASSSIGFTTGVWAMATGVWTSTTSRTAYCDASGASTNTVSRVTSTPTDWIVAGAVPEESLAEYEGQLAEVAIWEAALTADEIVSLYRGFKATQIRPSALKIYLPMIRETMDLRTGAVSVPFNPSFVIEHPRRFG